MNLMRRSAILKFVECRNPTTADATRICSGAIHAGCVLASFKKNGVMGWRSHCRTITARMLHGSTGVFNGSMGRGREKIAVLCRHLLGWSQRRNFCFIWFHSTTMVRGPRCSSRSWLFLS